MKGLCYTTIMKITLKMPCTDQVIKQEIDKYSAKIKELKTRIDIFGQAINHYQKQCKHPGQETGYNERDGSWGSPCPVCGYSY